MADDRREKTEAVSERDSNYEQFVRDVIQDFNSRVLTVQKKAEESARAYESLIGEMRVQIEDLKFENDALKRKCQENGQPALQFLSALTGLSVFCTSQSGTIQRFSCNIIDGILKGHSFNLTIDHNAKECTYNPEGSPLKNLHQVADDIAQEISFPECMLSRFLINILHVNYTNHQS